MDDDLKISMDDIKDIVSELFGEKIEKIDEKKAKEILKTEEKISIIEDFSKIELDKLTSDEENVLKTYEEEIKAERKVDTKQIADIEELKKKIEEEVREKIKKEIEEERAKRREEILKKIDEAKKEEVKEYALTNYSERVLLLKLFEQSQNLLKNLLIKFIRRTPVETMFLKTLEKAMERNREVLRKADCNQYNQIRTDGSIEIGRVLANVNALNLTEKQKEEKLFKALQDIFEERLIAVELAMGIVMKDEIISKLISQIEQIFNMKEFSPKLKTIFFEKIIPNTTLKQED